MPLSLASDLQSSAQGLGTPFVPVASGGVLPGGRHTPGTRIVDSDGNVYRYCQVASGAALVTGNWIQSPAQVPLHLNMIPTADVAIGAFAITFTLGATAASANQYAGGYVIISAGVGAGQRLRIASHPAALSGGVLTVTLAQPVDVALTAVSSKVDLQANPYVGVIQNPITTLTGVCVGVATSAAPAGSFDWLQTRGVGAALIAGTPGVGLALVVPGTAAGAAVIDGAASATPIVGQILRTGVDGAICAVMIKLE